MVGSSVRVPLVVVRLFLTTAALVSFTFTSRGVAHGWTTTTTSCGVASSCRSALFKYHQFPAKAAASATTTTTTTRRRKGTRPISTLTAAISNSAAEQQQQQQDESSTITTMTTPSSKTPPQQEADIMVRQVLTDRLKRSGGPLPKLLVFDLDNTLWTPELYQIRQKNFPKVNREIRLFDDAQYILQVWHDITMMKDADDTCDLPMLAVASRTSKAQWANHLLDEFQVKDGVSLRSLFQQQSNDDSSSSMIQIRTGSKKSHFATLRQATGLAYSEMLFFDDDARMNCHEISSQLGVLCCHTPRGLTREHFVKALQKYSELKAGHDASHWMGYVLNNENLGIVEETAAIGQVLNGRVKFFSMQKKFGFVIDEASGEEFFFHESKVPAGMDIKAGDKVTFESSADATGRPSAVILGGGGDNNGSATKATSSNADTTMATMPCFTMSQPFAALLLNGIKTVESRNNPMFENVKPGTKVLLHCGRRDWHDLESYREILLQEGKVDNNEIDRMGALPRGFRKGNIVGVVTVGRTWKATDAERKGKDLQRQVLAPFEGVGKFCTEITSAEWLVKPVIARGNPGLYQADVPQSHLSSDDKTI